MPAHADSYAISATANPARVIFGVDNNVTISVTVRDSNGSAVPDGTSVYFNTTLGTIPALAYTRSGQAAVLLSDTNAPEGGHHRHRGRQPEAVIVEYLGKGGVTVTEVQRISYHVKAKQVYSGVDTKLSICAKTRY